MERDDGGHTVNEVPILFLDMDSTVRQGYDELGRFVNGPDDVFVFPAVRDLMEQWKGQGGRIVTVSNQKGIGLGIVTRLDIERAMQETNCQAGHTIDVMMWCPHVDACWCRKPGIGMLVKGHAALERTYGSVFPLRLMQMVGDRPG